jgi:hypothetical protein
MRAPLIVQDGAMYSLKALSSVTGGQLEVQFDSSVTMMTIATGKGTDSVTIEALPLDCSLELSTNAGDDTVVVGSPSMDMEVKKGALACIPTDAERDSLQHGAFATWTSSHLTPI